MNKVPPRKWTTLIVTDKHDVEASGDRHCKFRLSPTLMC